MNLCEVQWLNGRMLELIEGLLVQDLPESLCCIHERDTLVLVQPMKTSPDMTEKLLTAGM